MEVIKGFPIPVIHFHSFIQQGPYYTVCLSTNFDRPSNSYRVSRITIFVIRLQLCIYLIRPKSPNLIHTGSHPAHTSNQFHCGLFMKWLVLVENQTNRHWKPIICINTTMCFVCTCATIQQCVMHQYSKVSVIQCIITIQCIKYQ